jgi:hypothetical protein
MCNFYFFPVIGHGWNMRFNQPWLFREAIEALSRLARQSNFADDKIKLKMVIGNEFVNDAERIMIVMDFTNIPKCLLRCIEWFDELIELIAFWETDHASRLRDIVVVSANKLFT